MIDDMTTWSFGGYDIGVSATLVVTRNSQGQNNDASNNFK